ncbi:hypothetical protein EDB86DRAFT_2838544 [Lactarius hatsudake]|nr:hypothetical protein EDB86DRAFT_2838544 [Lactarius hatsudake]
MSSVRRQGGTGVTCPHAHPFCANGADVGKGGAGGRRAHANVMVQTRGNGPRAPYLHAKGQWRSMWGTEWQRMMQEKGKRWAREAGGEGVLVPELAQDGSGPCGGSKSCLPLLGLLYSSRPPRPPICARKRTGRHSPPSPASHAAVRAQKAHYDKGRTGHSPMSGPPRLHGPTAPRPLPSQHLPHSHGKGAHEGMSPRSLPAGAWRTLYPLQSPSAQVMPAQLHAPRPARIRKRKEGHASPTPRAPPCPRTQEDGWRVQPCPVHARKGRDGAHSPALLGAGDTNPTPHAPPTFTRGGTVCPPPSARATPVQPPTPRTHKGEGQRVNTLRTGYASPAFMHPATPAHTWGCKRVGAPSPLRAGGACNGEGHMHTREGGTRNEGQCNLSVSGGVAQRGETHKDKGNVEAVERGNSERRSRSVTRLIMEYAEPATALSIRTITSHTQDKSGHKLIQPLLDDSRQVTCQGHVTANLSGPIPKAPGSNSRAGRGNNRSPCARGLHNGDIGGWGHITWHIGVWARKGESDGEGVVNKVKQSRGEAARANGRHPAHTSRLT